MAEKTQTKIELEKMGLCLTFSSDFKKIEIRSKDGETKQPEIQLEKMGLCLTFSDDLKQIEIHGKNGEILTVETLEALNLSNALYKMVTIWATKKTERINNLNNELKQENTL